ncbi:MAG TPA: NAD(P)-binding domain-containing protein, partial [Roseateles sp.]|nr:NAD(P)-binding domain-containing protein [Roseateles sp.]
MSIKIGFIGLGIMGAPMAARLAAGGHQLFVHTRSSVRDEVKAAGAVTVCASATEVAKQA